MLFIYRQHITADALQQEAKSALKLPAVGSKSLLLLAAYYQQEFISISCTL
jgi:hypothetical protein